MLEFELDRINKGAREQAKNFLAALVMWAIFGALFLVLYVFFGWSRSTPIVQGAISGRLEKTLSDILDPDSIALAVVLPFFAAVLTNLACRLIRRRNAFWIRILNVGVGALYNLFAFCFVAYLTIIGLDLASDVRNIWPEIGMAFICLAISFGGAMALGSFLHRYEPAASV